MVTESIGHWAAALGLALSASLTGCELFTDLDDIEPQCRPDTSQPCLCPDGSLGVQRCLGSGRYEECRCGDAGGSADVAGETSRDGSD
jgi:hypothetical protein